MTIKKSRLVLCAVLLVLCTAFASVAGTVVGYRFFGDGVGLEPQGAGAQGTQGLSPETTAAATATQRPALLASSGLDPALQSEKLNMMLQYIREYALTPVDDETLIEAMAKGMVENIGDKYAKYYDAEALKDLVQANTGNYRGVGMQVSVTKETNQIIVVNVYRHSPAEEAGLQMGDLITQTDGIDYTGDQLNECVTYITGQPEGTTVELTILRAGAQMTISPVVSEVTIDTAAWEMLEVLLDNPDYAGIGYLGIDGWDMNTADFFEEAIAQMTQKGMKGLIIDLRWNTGGLFDSAVALADKLLPEGVVVSTVDNLGNSKDERSDSAMLELPIVVLVNEYSASASEIFCAAVQDYGVATLVGVQTYGKGVVQAVRGLNDNTAFKLTTEEYYSPKGRKIDGVGLTPDVVVALPEEVQADLSLLSNENDTQMRKAVEVMQGLLQGDAQ